MAAVLLAARDLALPAWVDSSHHALIARLLAVSGMVPASYEPLLPVDTLYNHFGVHALVASLHWLAALPLPEAMLLSGQVLNGLMPLAAYTLAVALTRRTTLPPLDYAFDLDLAARVATFNASAAQIEDVAAPETLRLLRSAGVTHVFIGARGGTFRPEMFMGQPSYRLLYSNGAAWVFEVVGGGP